MTRHFQEYLREYGTDGIGRLLYELILDVTTNTVRKYPPDVYSTSGQWDHHEISGLAHDFAVERLIGKGQLNYLLLNNETVASLSNGMEYLLRQFLIDRRRRTQHLNFYQRTKSVLQGDGTYKLVADDLWGLAEWDDDRAVAQVVSEVIQAAYKCSLPPFSYYHSGSAKISHLIANKDLERLISTIFTTTGKLLPFQLLLRAIYFRLNLPEYTVFSLDEPVVEDEQTDFHEYVDCPTAYEAPESTVITKDEAAFLFERLTDRQREILVFRTSSPKETLDEIGKQLGIGKSTVGNDLKSIQKKIEDLGLNLEEAERMLAETIDICNWYLQVTKNRS